MYLLDTNAIIYHLKDDAKTVPVLREVFNSEKAVYISAITEVELFGYPNLGNEEAERIEIILRTISIIPLDSHIARIAGSIRKLYRLKTPDSVVAATALFTSSILVTRNVKDFKRIPEISVREV